MTLSNCSTSNSENLPHNRWGGNRVLEESPRIFPSSADRLKAANLTNPNNLSGNFMIQQ